MTSDDRMTWGMIHEVLSALERHGYHQYDDQHTGRVFPVIQDEDVAVIAGEDGLA